MSLTGIFNSHLMMATVVENYGTDFQKDYWLPKFCSGEIRGALGLTEPNAGTDLQAIKTVAKKDGDHYVINVCLCSLRLKSIQIRARHMQE